jgi:replicative DNA helicase
LKTEEIIVGLCIARPDVLEHFLANGVTPNLFADADLGHIFATILDLDNQNLGFDLVSVAHRLGGGDNAVKLAELYELGATSQSPKYLADELHSEVLDRKVRSIAADISRIANGVVEGQTALDRKALVAAKIDDLLATGEQRDEGIKAHVLEYLDFIEKCHTGKATKGVSTGYQALDRLIHGFCPEAFYILGARTGVGKSELCTNFFYNVASQKIPTAYFSFEMTAKEILGRMASRICGVSDAKLANGDCSSHELDGVVDAGRAISDLPLHIVDHLKPEWSSIKLKIRLLARRNGVRVVFLDYIQQLNSVGFRASERVRELTHISNEIKQLAKELKIAIVCAAQLNRQAGDRDDDVPNIRQLKESGSLEQDANVVMLLHRSGKNSQTDLMVEKNRHGVSGCTVKMDFNYAIHTITEARR